MARTPTGTYRLQLHAGFGFDAAAEIAAYLEALGISHVYSSPYLQAAPGSQHGYDVVDHHKVNEELGGAEAHERFSKRLGACHLGQVLDIVPNHMAIGGRRNRYWWDVLENGASSRYSTYFDIDWASHEERLRNKLLVPILGDHYGRILARGEVSMERNGGDFYVKYFDHELPAAPRSLPFFLRMAATESGSEYLAFLADSLENLPHATTTGSEKKAQRHRDKAVVNGLLERLFTEVPFIAETVDSILGQINKDPDRLHDLLEQQNFRLAYWRASDQDLGYRRFFDVNTLAGLRVEDPQVLSDSHALILKWLHEGILDGVRVDHPDGLRDPRLYFERLRAEAPNAWIVGEKILEPGEKLRTEWPIDGTTGYDFLNQAGGLFVDSSHEEAFTRIYSEFIGGQVDYAAECRNKKHLVLRELLGSDVNRLTSLFMEICELHRDRRDYTRKDGTRAVREMVACLSVYRTYVVPERDELTDDDIRYVNEALTAAKENRQELDAELFDFMADILLLRVRGELESEFVFRFQQFCGPVMAKGIEDTVFYDYVRLIALNEVGGDAGVFGVEPEQFHRWCEERQKSHPRAMLASSTHDTKRSEDVRARISVLSEIPVLWKDAIERWSEITEKYKRKGCPDRNTEYFLYQTMLGAWPIGTDRLLPYMEKACREGKRHTNWLTPNEDFELATRRFIEGIYKDQKFLKDFEAFVATVIEPGRINALAQVLLKLTAPGVPDIYQGTELWDLSLVDPDNRRAVDYDLRKGLVAELPHLKVDEVWQRMEEGLPKLWTIWHALGARQKHLSAFGEAEDYEPVYARGSKAHHVVAFLRGGEILVLVPRLPVKLDGDWAETTIEIPRGNWDNVLTQSCIRGGKLLVKEILAAFPVALLVKR